MEGSAERLLVVISASRPETKYREEGDIPGATLADYSMERRRKQKMLCSQLQVLHFLLEFLEQEDTASWETNPETLSREVDEVKQTWKELKAEYQEKVKDIKDLLPELLHKQRLLQERKRHLECALQRYRHQREAAETAVQRQVELELQFFQDSMLEKVKCLDLCQVRIGNLEDEIQRLVDCADSWIRAALRSSAFSGLLRALQGVSFVSVAENELALDLNVDLVPETPALRLNLCWTPRGDLHLTTDGSVLAPPQALLPGSVSHLTSVILELQSWYRSQARVLQELGVLQQRFAIDWDPVERSLVFLKGGTQYRLLLDPGYPVRGGVRLGPHHSVPDTFKPPVMDPSLTDWLEFLQNAAPV